MGLWPEIILWAVAAIFSLGFLFMLAIGSGFAVGNASAPDFAPPLMIAVAVFALAVWRITVLWGMG